MPDKIVYKKPKDYDDFVKTLKGLKTDRQRIDYIMEYFKHEVNFNYEYLTFAYLETDVKGITPFKNRPFPALSLYAREIDNETNKNGEYLLLTPKQMEENLTRLLAKMKKNFPESATISKQTQQKILSEYEKLNKQKEPYCLSLAVSRGEPKLKEEKNGLLTLGVCRSFCLFMSKLFADLGINYKQVTGNTGKASHEWLVITTDREELCYDPTYSIYVRDNYNNWGKKAKWEDFVGVTYEHILKLNPTRTITSVVDGNSYCSDNQL